MPPAVIDAMTGFRAQLDAQKRSQSLRMAQAWLEITYGLDGELEPLAMEADKARASGRPLTLWHVSRMDRYQSLMRQVSAHIREFEPVAVLEVTQAQSLMARWGIDRSQQLTAMQLPGIEGQFDRLPVEAVQNMVGNAGDGTPLGRLLRNSWRQQAPDVYGAPANSPQIGAADSFVDELMEYARTGDKDRLLRRITYVEAQMQGGVELSDVDYVIDHDRRLMAADCSWLQSLRIGVR